MSIEQSMEKNHTGEELTGDCLRCRYKKGVGNRAYHGPKIPGGSGKCIRPGGLCEAKANGEGTKHRAVQKSEEIGKEAVESSEGETMQLVPLSIIRPAPWNPPGRMVPEKVRDLAENFLQVGQQQPALIRPVEAEAPIKYEIVFGHRRAAAWKELSARSPLPAVIPAGGVPLLKACIRSMSESEAMILSGVENLQREGFSGIEEAEFFQTCAERLGESAVSVLAEKLSVSERYVRKRIEILKLPEEALNLWREGSWHIGHMEQLLRLGGNDEVSNFLTRLSGQYQLERLPVHSLKEMIDRRAVRLGAGKFEKTECKVCRKNTRCQLSLFGGEEEKVAKCLDPECFCKRQQAWYDVNWASCKQNKAGTKHAIVSNQYNPGTGTFDYYLYGERRVPERCGTCDELKSVIGLSGEVQSEQVCFGDNKCFKTALAEIERQGRGASGSGGSTAGQGATEEAPRVQWHGEYFRQQYYREQVPQLHQGMLTEDRRPIQLVLACIIHRHPKLHDWFRGQFQPRATAEEGEGYMRFSLRFSEIIELVRDLGPMKAEYLAAQASVKAALEIVDRYCDEDRQALAEFFGIDFSGFEVSEEWFQKKTKGEIIRFIQDVGLDEETGFCDAMKVRGFLKLEELARAKKGEIVNLVRNCGVDLHGLVPKEIANRPVLKGLRVHEL